MIEIRLREILKQRGISIRSFADKLGVVPNSLPISVAFSPSLSSLQRYAEALNIPTIELVHEPAVPTSINDGKNHRDAESVEVFVLRRILEEMHIQRLSQKHIADKMGVTVQSFSQTLKKNKMSTATLEKIANALSVEPWSLFVERKDDLQNTSQKTLPHTSSSILVMKEQRDVGIRNNREVQMEEGVTYVFDNTRISVKDGVLEITVKRKDC